jgi:hypothetical protein
MKRSDLISSASVLATFLALATPASATSVASSGAQLTVFAEAGQRATVVSHTNTGDVSVARSATATLNGATALATATAINQVGLSASAVSDYHDWAHAGSFIDYTITVYGPGVDPVVVNFTADLSTSIQLPGPNGFGDGLFPTANAAGHLVVRSDLDTAQYDVGSCSGFCILTADPEVLHLTDGAILATPHTSITVSEWISAYADYGASAQSSADPYFYLSPALIAAGYTVTASQGVANSPSAAPEPATWAQMMLAVGGMGASLRTRRRAVKAG